jgi:putative FmdB family regulatory protein
MPLHEYVPLEPPGCALCCYGFEIMQGLNDEKPTHCPACGGAIRHVLGATPTIVGQALVLREDNVARHGFTQYRRVGKGRYEKTAGKGPDTISGD